MASLSPVLLGLLDEQAGVVGRSQALELGHEPHDLRRWVRQRLLVPVHEGVYVDHTGPLTWQQRALAAVLYAAPAALHGCCALRAAHGPGWRGHDDTAPVHVAIDVLRRVARQPGVEVHRVAGMSERTLWQRCPPRMRVEEAVLDVASTAVDDFAAVQVVAAAVGARSTTAARLDEALSRRSRIARRVFLQALLDDDAQGACSVLEIAYLRDVERATDCRGGDGRHRGRTAPACAMCSTSSSGRSWSWTVGWTTPGWSIVTPTSTATCRRSRTDWSRRGSAGARPYAAPAGRPGRWATCCRPEGGRVSRPRATAARERGRSESPGDSDLS